jgi:CelD/BcsL family acetyltransferase involved in cellulose biosynthesis
MTAHPATSTAFTGSEPHLLVRTFETLEQMEAVKDAWQDLEARDPEGTVYLSWRWMQATFRNNPWRWRVFAAFHGKDLVCVFPVKYRVHWSDTHNQFQTEMEAAGRLAFSEYSGFLCDPAYEQAALNQIAQRMQQLPWTRMSIRYEDSRERTKLFLSAFSPAEFSAKEKPYFINKGKTDNLVCPRVKLPESYEAYLVALGRNMRTKIRRFGRKYIDSGEMAVKWAKGPQVPPMVDRLLEMWFQKWGPIKGADNARKGAQNYRDMLMQAAELGLLRMPSLWQGDRCLAVLAHVVDPHHRKVHFVVTGRDERFDGNQVGPLLHAATVRWAISENYEVYDLCHGDEAYKFGYGAVPQRVNYFTVRRLNPALGPGMLDPICLPRTLERITAQLEAGKGEAALAGCKQLLSLTHARRV